MAETGEQRPTMNFNGLVIAIQNAHDRLSRQAVKAVNISLTVRNWLIGYYIREYEQKGTDRAKYGANLLQRISERLPKNDAFSYRSLKLYRQFYDHYPEIGKSVIAQLQGVRIGQSPPAQFEKSITDPLVRVRNEILLPIKRQTLSVQSRISVQHLLTALSFTHFVELLKLDDLLKRAFYETECIKGNWSVRELKRQITSLYFERCGLSKDKNALSKLVQSAVEADSLSLTIRDPYVFEFLGLRPKDVMHENDLEAALLDKLEDFLLEMGRGFCFEARQKRILIGGEYLFMDLVLYHRILKCHVLLELKMDAFKHEYLGQLNTYLSWFKTNEMTSGDHPPIGILLCTDKNHALVKYALANMNNKLFVSKYQLKLPSRKELQAFVETQLKETKP